MGREQTWSAFMSNLDREDLEDKCTALIWLIAKCAVLDYKWP